MIGDLIRRDDVDPRGLSFLIHSDGSEFSAYERGYNDAVVSCYYLTQNARSIPIVHGGCPRCAYARMVERKYGKVLNPENCDLHRDKMCPELDDEEASE